MAHHQPEVDDPFDDEAGDDVIVQREWNRAENDIRKVSQWGEQEYSLSKPVKLDRPLVTVMC